MTDNRIIEEMAKLNGYKVGEHLHNAEEHCVFRIPDSIGKGKVYVPNYLTDLNATHRVICGLSGAERAMFGVHLCRIMAVNPNHNYTALFKATARQQCEAIMWAKGKWEGSNG